MNCTRWFKTNVAFWFRFIYPNLEYIETNPDVVIRLIKKEMNEYLGLVFEKICKQFLIKKQIMPSMKIGTWWHKEHEIDIVALDEHKKQIIFFHIIKI